MTLTSLLSLGFIPGIVSIGQLLLPNARNPREGIENDALAVVIGLALCLPLLLSLAFLGIHNAAAIGLAGWIFAGSHLAISLKRNKTLSKRRLGSGDWIILSLALVSFIGNAIHSSENLLGSQQYGLNASAAVHIAKHGSIGMDPATDDLLRPKFKTIADESIPLGTQYGTTKLKYPIVAPLYLTHFYSIGGYKALLSFTPLIGALNLALFFGIATRLSGRKLATVATIAFAFFPSQILGSRIADNGILTQAFLLAGILTILKANRAFSKNIERFGYVLIGSVSLLDERAYCLLAFVPFANFAALLYAPSPEHTRTQIRPNTLNSSALFIVSIAAFTINQTTSPPFTDNEIFSIAIFAALGLIFMALSLAFRNRAFSNWSKRELTTHPAWEYCALALAVGCLVFFWKVHNALSLALLVIPGTIGIVFILKKIILENQTRFCLLSIVWIGYAFSYLLGIEDSSGPQWKASMATPILIPGLIIFTAHGLHLANYWIRIPTLRSLLNLLALGTATTFIAINTWSIATHKEQSGTIDQLQFLSLKIPDGALCLTDFSPEFLAPLQLAGSDRILRGDFADPIQRATLAYIGNAELKKGRKVLVLRNETKNDTPLEFHLSPFDGNLSPDFGDNKIELNLYDSPGVSKTGLHALEGPASSPFRWTEAVANYRVPMVFEEPPLSIHASIMASRPNGSQLDIYVEGILARSIEIPPGSSAHSLILPVFAIDDDFLDLRIETPGWSASEFNPNSRDPRTLGIALGRLEVLFGRDQYLAPLVFGAVPVSGIDESGLHSTERIDGVDQRWTDGHARFFIENSTSQAAFLELEISDALVKRTEIKVLWNGVRVHASQFNENQPVIRIPLDAAPVSDIEQIDILSQAAEPKNLDINDDQRLLGLLLKQIRLYRSKNTNP